MIHIQIQGQLDMREQLVLRWGDIRKWGNNWTLGDHLAWGFDQTIRRDGMIICEWKIEPVGMIGHGGTIRRDGTIIRERTIGGEGMIGRGSRLPQASAIKYKFNQHNDIYFQNLWPIGSPESLTVKSEKSGFWRNWNTGWPKIKSTKYIFHFYN